MNSPGAERPVQGKTTQSQCAPVTDETDFLAALPIIDDVTRQVCRRHHMDPVDSEEFRSDVRMHFIQNDYEVLRRYEHRSSLATYVSVVVQRLLLDRRNRLWGRWRPSTDARRLGPTGVLLERLISRDGWTADQAIETVQVNHGVVIDGPLQAFCERTAARGPARKFVAEEDAADVVSDGPGADVNVVRAEQDFMAKRVQAALDRARQGLPPMERLILKMRFDDRIPVVDIARALHLDQRRLYRTIERILGVLRAAMMADGVSKDDIEALLADDERDWNQMRETAQQADDGMAAERGRQSWLQRR